MKKVVIVAALLIAVCLGLWQGRGPYRRWKQDRSLAQARAFLAKSDYRNALLGARETLEINPGNVDACRLMATVTERVKSPQAITWRLRLIEFEPKNTQNRLDLVRTALLLGDYPRAIQALGSIDVSAQNTVDFHTMAAMVAIAQGDLASATKHYVEAAHLAPQDKTLQLDLAVLNLQSKDKQVAGAALNSLEKLYTDPGCRRDALRHLVLATVRNKDYAKADAFSRQLIADTPVAFEDRILRLLVLREAQSLELSAYLASIEKDVAGSPDQISQLCSWLVAHRMVDDATQWLKSLPAKMLGEQVVALSLAECYSARQDWAAMQALLEANKWANLDFLRFALLARVAREQKQDLASQANWRSAVSAATGRAKPLATLVRMTDAWGWDREKEETAWLLLQRFPAERWALEMLYRLYAPANNTRGMQRVYAGLMACDNSDLVARNNYASLSLLLGLQVNKAADIARENYTQHPQDIVLASTYAYALHLQRQTREGIKLFEKFPDAQLRQPGIAIYYGVLLAADGQVAKANQFLDIADRAQLLPEEKKLVAAARNTPVSLK